ncbi:MAG: IclR family transcriptional regulator [Chloroflexota bacterium]
MTTATGGAQAVVRALRILKLFSGKHLSLSLKQVIEATQLNRTTVFRLLSTLVAEGFLVRLENGDYQLGPELTALGGLAGNRDGLRRIARPILEELVETVGERTTLEVPSRGSDGRMTMLVIDEVSDSHRLGITEFAGNHLPIYATSTGKAFMAFSNDEMLDGIFSEPVQAFTSKTPVSRPAVEKDLAKTKSQAYALVIEELEEGLVAIGAPIFDASGTVCAAISIAGPTVRMTAERIPELVVELQKSAELISQRMGYR